MRGGFFLYNHKSMALRNFERCETWDLANFQLFDALLATYFGIAYTGASCRWLWPYITSGY